jgi:hypothetical protein
LMLTEIATGTDDGEFKSIIVEMFDEELRFEFVNVVTAKFEDDLLWLSVDADNCPGCDEEYQREIAIESLKSLVGDLGGPDLLSGVGRSGVYLFGLELITDGETYRLPGELISEAYNRNVNLDDVL